ncbi:MAG: HAD hydrolase, family IB [Candidatus Saccharibacteria bacterium GW2011_GWA2_46_10]|nr:MAG: HAD hydrolase, family IB [Candidatus Saccharibacteria bacterium GW2011_GWA2_46_10]OGL35865.1 MAG: hypothetical protein A3F05_00810 [Candidatus Saccharibacteria bacterium RIFCSPHIGHO2_12_FULL_47_17]
MKKYGERVSQPATQQSAKSAGGVASSARQQASTAQRPFAVFDIDGTLVRWQLYHAIADELVKLGYINSRAFQSVKDARMQWKKRSGPEAFQVYERKLVWAYEKMLLKLTFNQFQEAAENVFKKYKDQVYTYTRELIWKLKKDGYVLFAISNSQIEIVSRIADYYGFDDCIGTYYHHEGGRFTGAATIPLGAKHLVLAELVKKHGLGYSQSLAVGDSSSDITILEAVEIPIAFNPERKLFEHAQNKGWKVVVERKNMIYELKAEDGRYILA